MSTVASFNPASDTGRWDMSVLTQTPAVERGELRPIQEGDRTVLLSKFYYGGEFYLGKPTRTFAYYAYPSEYTAPLPAMILVHGGGGTASAEWACHWAGRGYAALALDLYGRGPDGERLPDGGSDWSDLDIAFRLTAGITNGWIYQAVACVIRGISALASLPEVDAARVGITGVSWGGILTCFVMSLDSRLKLAIPVYGCGFNPGMGLPPNPTEAECERVRAHFEPGRYFPRCVIPVLWINGTNEPHATWERLQQSHHAVSGPSTLSVTVRPPHMDPQGADLGWERPEICRFADSIFRGTAGLTAVGSTEIKDDMIRVTCVSPVPLQDAVLHWTTDTEKDWRYRHWQSAWANIKKDEVQAELPTMGPAFLFLTLTDRRGAVVSTNLIHVSD